MAVKKFDFTKGNVAQGQVASPAPGQSAVLSMLTGGVSQQFAILPVEMLDTYPDQNMYSMGEDELQWLTESVAEKGVLQPIAVRTKSSGRYEILAGHRRTEAARRAHVAAVPAIVYTGLDDGGAEYIFHATNLGSRSGLKPSERAHAYAAIERIMAQKNLLGARTTAAIADETNENVRTIQRYKKLLELPEQMQQHIDAERVPLTAATSLARMSHITLRRLAADLDENPQQMLTGTLVAELLEKEVACGATVLTAAQIIAVLRPKSAQKQRTEKPDKAEQKKTGAPAFKLDFAPIAHFFQAGVTKQEAEAHVMKALEFFNTYCNK